MLATIKIEKIIGKYDNGLIVLNAKIENYEILEGEKVEHEGAIRSRMIVKAFNQLHDAIEKDTYVINADLQFDKKYNQFYFYAKDAYLNKIELDTEFEKYMIKHIEGIGKSKAKKVMEHLGQNAIEKISGEDGFSLLCGIVKPELAQRIVNDFMKNRNLYEIMTFLYQNQLGVKMLNDIIDEYGIDKALEINDNPYLFSKVIDFKKLDRIASVRSNIDAKDIRRIIAGITSYVAYNLKENGSLFTYVNDIYENIEEYINANRSYETITLSVEEIKYALEQIRINHILTVKNGECLYMKNIANKEDNICYNLSRLNRIDYSGSGKQIEDAIKSFEKENKKKLSDEQSEAVVMAMMNNLSVLTGLPGSGKTLTIKAIIYVYMKLNPDANIKQIAPTGKASKRMQEVSRFEAQTIHRALKLQGDRSLGEEVEADFIIIDEASMIDIYVIDKLLNNVKFNTKVLIVGDIEQLPSIGPGLILKDIIDSDVIATTRLTKPYRQEEGSNIITNAHAIANKTMTFNFNGDVILWKSEDEDTIYEHVKKSYMRLLEKGEERKQIVVLSPIKIGKVGVDNLNKMIQENFNVGSKEVQVSPYLKIKEKDLVMHTENNYTLGVFNGEVGQVKKVKLDDNGKPVIEVKYDDREDVVVYEKEDVKQLNLAYCMTVHKSQGSEYKNVISIVSDTHKKWMNKNLIYTAWTRAKEFLIVLGTEETIKEVVAQKSNVMNRNSNLSDMLRSTKFRRDIEVKDYNEVF